MQGGCGKPIMWLDCNGHGKYGASSVHMTKHFYDVHLRHHVILRHVMVRHIIVLRCHVGDIYVFVSSCKCYSRLVNVCHGFVPSCFCYFCHTNVFHAHACHAIVCHAIVTSCKCLSCKRDHVNERHTSASSRVPRWLPFRQPPTILVTFFKFSVFWMFSIVQVQKLLISAVYVPLAE